MPHALHPSPSPPHHHHLYSKLNPSDPTLSRRGPTASSSSTLALPAARAGCMRTALQLVTMLSERRSLTMLPSNISCLKRQACASELCQDFAAPAAARPSISLWQCLTSAAASPRGAVGGSGRLGRSSPSGLMISQPLLGRSSLQGRRSLADLSPISPPLV